MVSVGWKFVSLGGRRGEEDLRGPCPAPGVPGLLPPAASVVAQKPPPLWVPGPAHPLQAVPPAVRQAAGCPPAASGSGARRCPAQPEGLGRPVGGQAAAPGQQLSPATGSERPGPGSKHLGAGEGGERSDRTGGSGGGGPGGPESRGGAPRPGRRPGAGFPLPPRLWLPRPSEQTRPGAGRRAGRLPSAPGRRNLGPGAGHEGEAQARTCPLPGPREPEPD